MPTQNSESGHEPRPEGDVEHLVRVLSERWVISLATLDEVGNPYVTPLYFAMWGGSLAAARAASFRAPSPGAGLSYDVAGALAAANLRRAGEPAVAQIPAGSRADTALGPVPTLIFASSPSSAHGRHLAAGPTFVAGAVAWEAQDVGLLRGVQLRGLVVREDRLSPSATASARADYLHRHPVAEPMLARGGVSLYVLRLRWAKLTDNRLGIGVHPVFHFPGHSDGDHDDGAQAL